MTEKIVQSRRFPELDALRGIAAFAVVLFHYTFGYDNAFGQLADNKFYFGYGYLGVSLFFIISGFVIQMTLEKTIGAKDFIVARFSRLYPVYWTAILLTVLVTSLLAVPTHKPVYTTTQVLVNFTMLQSFFKIKDVDGVYWTLAVELLFYFWLWAVFKLKKLKHIEWICLAWMAVSVIIFISDMPLKKYLGVLFIIQYAPLFIAGILFYQLKKGKRSVWLHLMITASLLLKLYFQHATETATPSSVNSSIVSDLIIVVFYIIFYLFALDRLTFLSGRIFIFLGGISYPLYLIHENIGYTVIDWMKQLLDKQIFYIPITIAIVTGMAYIINRYIEKPAVRKIRDYLNTKSNTKKVHQLVTYPDTVLTGSGDAFKVHLSAGERISKDFQPEESLY